MRHVQVPVPAAHMEVVIPRACIEKISLTDVTECRYVEGEIDDHGNIVTHCTPIKLDKFRGCEIRQAVKNKKGATPK